MLTTAAIAPSAGEPFVFDEIELDAPRADELVVRIVATGLCHTDLSVRAGRTPLPLPGVLGHEGAGIVEEVGPEAGGFAPGDHVLLSYSSCGACRNCLRGDLSNCADWAQRNLLGGRRADGTSTIRWRGREISGSFFGQSAFSRHALVHVSCAVPVSPEAPLELLAPLGCGIQTGVGTVLNVLRPEPQDSIVVFGAGAVGLSAVMGAMVAGVKRIAVVDRVESRLRLAAELGAGEVFSDAGIDLAGAAGDGGFTHAIEATGRVDVLESALGSLAPGGVCAVVGAPPAGSRVSVDIKHLMRGRSLVGVTEGRSNPRSMIPWLVDRFLDGDLPVDRLVRTYEFSELETAVSDAISGAAVKPVVLMPRD